MMHYIKSNKKFASDAILKYLIIFSIDNELRELKSSSYSPSDWRQRAARGVGCLRWIFTSKFLNTVNSDCNVS